MVPVHFCHRGCLYLLLLLGFVQKLATFAFCITDDNPQFGPSRSHKALSASRNPHQQLSTLPLTSALLRVSYDGTRFTGWSAANDSKPGLGTNSSSGRVTGRRRGRSRIEPPLRGNVRSVEGVLRKNLAKLYGNLDPQCIVVEGSSRTDKGVHARSMMAMIYGLNQTAIEKSPDGTGRNISGKRTPHPANATDSSVFLPLPMNMTKIAFALNRMLPPDIRIMGIAPIPNIPNKVVGAHSTVFHPTLSAIAKTYVYTFSVSTRLSVPDPTTRRWVWHTKTARNQAKEFDIEKANQACQMLQGTHNFSAFQGAPRGLTDKQKRLDCPRDTICTLQSVTVKKLDNEDNLHFEPASPQYILTITGDRFLYKMVRLLTGAIVEIGNGRLELDELRLALERGERSISFQCAPAHGLKLHNVDYNIRIDWQPLHN